MVCCIRVRKLKAELVTVAYFLALRLCNTAQLCNSPCLSLISVVESADTAILMDMSIKIALKWPVLTCQHASAGMSYFSRSTSL